METSTKEAESFQGTGEIKCYGEIDVTATQRWETLEGRLNCRPTIASSAPQGFIADGDDGSHWVSDDWARESQEKKLRTGFSSMRNT